MNSDQLETLKDEAVRVLEGAELLHSAAEVEAALDQMAAAITGKLHDKNPLVLSPMLGGLVVTGKLLTRLKFPLQLEYIHATRYLGNTRGGDLEWQRLPQGQISGRTVLIVDDILDEGITMLAMVSACRAAGAVAVYTAVLLDKQLNRPKQFRNPDFTGLTVPDRYVFGYGMDYKEYLRNCDGIYAVQE